MNSMKRCRAPLSTGLLVVLVAVVAAGCSNSESEFTASVPSQAKARLVKVGPDSLWRTANVKPLPPYPEASLEAGVEGVVVAEVIVATDGRAESIAILEAPDKRIAESVQTTIREWVFVPPRIAGSDQDARALGKLIFYFEVEDESVYCASALPRVAGKPPATAQLPSPSSLVELPNLEALRLLEESAWVLLDVRGREASRRQPYANSPLNIPFDELPVRSASELNEVPGVIVNCDDLDGAICEAAVRLLRELGVEAVKASVVSPAPDPG